MSFVPIPVAEAERLIALRSYDVLDTARESAFDNIAHLAARLTGTPTSLVTLVDAERQWFRARYGLDAPEISHEHAFCVDAILDPDELLVVRDMRLDPRFAGNPAVHGERGIRFYAAVPLVTSEGAVIGTLCVIDHVPREITDDQRQGMKWLAEMLMTTLELRRAMIQVRNLTLIDMLTGIPNRLAIFDAIERAISRLERHGDSFTLLYLDLDGFKRVNDLHGHAMGDQVLREVATALRIALRREDIVGRIGGDEFAVLLVGGEADAIIVAERVRTEVGAHMDARGWPVTASIGVAWFPNPPDSADAALAAADALMYGAKIAGKDRIRHRDHVISFFQ